MPLSAELIPMILAGLASVTTVAVNSFRLQEEIRARLRTLLGTSDDGDEHLIELKAVKPNRVKEFLYQLGLQSDSQVEHFVTEWKAPKGFTQEVVSFTAASLSSCQETLYQTKCSYASDCL